jgi:hypothetical protein
MKGMKPRESQQVVSRDLESHTMNKADSPNKTLILRSYLYREAEMKQT